MENMWDVVSSKEKEPTQVQDMNATETSPPTNRTEIFTGKKKDQVALRTIWDCVENLIFFHVKSC